MKELILLTSGFPFGMGETFLETEIKYLAERFDKVTLISINPSNQTQRSLPENCHVTALNINIGGKEKFKALSYLLSGLFWKEIRVIRDVYKMRLTKGIINTMLISLYRATVIERHLQNSIKLKDQVFYSYWCDDAALALGLLKENHPNNKAVCRTHGWDVYFEVHNVNYLPYRHFITDQLDAIYPISEKGKEYITEQWKVTNPKKVNVSRLGVVAQEKVTPSGTFTLVSCSNLIPLKRVELIIEALNTIIKKPINWTHFGDGVEKQRLMQLAKGTLGSNVNWEFKGRLSNKEVIQWYRENNPSLFINLSSSEGIPVSIMEAMSFGIPVIATNVGGTSEIVNNENGRLLDPNPSSEDVAEVIDYFYNLSEVDYSKYSEIAYNTWKEKYNAEKNYKKFLATISSL